MKRSMGFQLALGTFVLLARFAPASAQDLLQRYRQGIEASAPQVETYRGRDRVDLRLGADLRPEHFKIGQHDQGSARIGLAASADVDFACGRFDVNASLKSRFGKEAREEYVDGLINYALSEITGSALTLLCEASPTACDIFKHHRINANAMLKADFDWCAAVQQGIDTGIENARANAIKACLNEKQRQGMTIDQAKEACKNADRLTGLGGAQVTEINVVQDLARALNLSPRDQESGLSLLSNMTYSASGARGEIKVDAVLELYLKKRKQFYDGYRELVEGLRTGRKPTDAELRGVTPNGADPVHPAHLLAMTRMSPALLDLYLWRMAGISGRVDLEGEVGQLERQLAAGRKDPIVDRGYVQWLEKEIVDLKRQLEQLRERQRAQEEWNEAMAKISTAAEASMAENAALRHYIGENRNSGQETLAELPQIGCMTKPDPRMTSRPRSSGATGRPGISFGQ